MHRPLQRKCACGGTPGPTGECAECRKKRLGLQRKEAVLRSPEPAVAPPIVHDVLRSPGRPLEPETRSFMESRFGHDFGKVRVHADAQAAESAQAVGALAYTVGSHVAFDHGRYAPGSGEGKELLAHELAHVVQQGPSPVPASGLPISPVSDPLESRADSAAAAALRGKAFHPGRVEPGLQRKPRDPDERFRGSTLPYREATELLKCNKIMKDPEYCRREVLGEEPIRPTAGCGWFAVKMTPYTTGLEGTIEFYPDPKSCPKCNLIRLVQVLRISEKPGVDYPWPGAEAPKENVKTAEDKKLGVQPNFFVDHQAANCSKDNKCSLYYRDHWPNATHSQDGSNDGKTAVHASLWDRPRGDKDDVFEFETCARCNDTGDYLGCVDWGFTADASGKATATSNFEHGAPSATFKAAVKKFDTYYKNP